MNARSPGDSIYLRTIKQPLLVHIKFEYIYLPSCTNATDEKQGFVDGWEDGGGYAQPMIDNSHPVVDH